jgi:hypothetical protein
MDFDGRLICAAVTHLGDKSNPVPVKITLVVGIILTTVSDTYFSALSIMNMVGDNEILLVY